jgi:HAD superfamily hydrolase (TIGR01549 family)
MIKAVLLDLDNTLLHNPDRQFATAFLEAFDAHFKQAFNIDQISRSFRQGIQQLSQIRNGSQTNTHLMVSLLSDATQITTEQIQKSLQLFYETSYRELQPYTSTVGVAQQLVTHLLEENVAVAIATNPIYPQVAVHQRIEWAGLTGFLDSFAFVTHSDNMHFAKPHPAYYAEVIARIGIEPDETLMVGDSIRNDIQPSQQLGIHPFHVTDANPLEHIK